ncbi:ribosome recycling factor family protein [Vibrio sp. CAU 1672]|uniref:ribosome recycling factor family protein n=1 Tax=Vibrio sp. CAU 1672 TaxID=3032594 RepID=UPI0023DADE9A|nr:ribosome recycling factor family protein [Vibrio sp. CAU 1672]MDF2152947.1 ribosome recycling factor family protein [Vibrio sp. CAU 1672]
MKDTQVTIPLPSLIHRIGGDHARRTKSIAAERGCELKRVRRSRHWQITGEALDLKAFVDHIKAEDSERVRFVINKIEAGLAMHSDKLEPLEEKLIRIVQQNPNITLAELMAETNCTLAQARVARFEAEML